MPGLLGNTSSEGCRGVDGLVDTATTNLHDESCLSTGGEPQSAAPFPIAVVGMAMRLPGGVNTADEFWDMLINKRDGCCEVPGTRYNIDAFYGDSKPGMTRTRRGYYLQEDISQMDTGFFGISKPEAARLDPQQRLLLEVIWECMENGGQVHWRGSNIGCYVGVFGEDWLEMANKDVLQVDKFYAISTGDFAISNRVSYEYDLQGPR